MTDILYNQKKVKMMKVFTSGEDSIWMRFIFEDGKSVNTMVFKGEI
jgi:hypothetical protein